LRTGERKKWCWWLWRSAAAIALLICSTAEAANIVVGNHVLLANTPNQTITIQITGGEQVAGEDFFAQIGDGGTYNGGSNVKPVFTNIDIIGGTIFAANNVGAFGDPTVGNAAHPLIWDDGTTTVSSSVSATGVLANLTIDTTGLSSGSFPLLLTGVANAIGPNNNTTLNNANGIPISLSVTNGLLTVSPFPAADYNHNGLVDAADYTIWRDTLGQNVTGGSGADGDRDGTVTQNDYNLWKSEFGYSSTGSGAAAVPEPRTDILIVIGLLTAMQISGFWSLVERCSAYRGRQADQKPLPLTEPTRSMLRVNSAGAFARVDYRNSDQPCSRF
jgi:hypothetical protein